MALFRTAPPATFGGRTTALVISATAPPEHAPRWGSDARITVEILVNPGPGPVRLAAQFPAREEHWLVRGMDIPVGIDPARPAEFTVDWAAIPSMAQRAAMNDPPLADPLGASRRVAHALGRTPADTGTARRDRFTALMSAAAGTAPPAGYQCAVVLVATIRGRYETTGSDDGPTYGGVTWERNSAAVLAVNVPGRAPYALYRPKFKYPRGRLDISGAGVPALVSTVDADRVDIRWDQAPSVSQQIVDRVATGGARTAGTLPPHLQPLMRENLRRSLAQVRDPAQRAMILNQARAMGLDLGPDER